LAMGEIAMQETRNFNKSRAASLQTARARAAKSLCLGRSAVISSASPSGNLGNLRFIGRTKLRSVRWRGFLFSLPAFNSVALE